jgi:hypothetical protein
MNADLEDVNFIAGSGTFFGQLIDDVTNLPVPGAEVDISQPLLGVGFGTINTATTANDGTFQISRLAAGEHEISVVGQGIATLDQHITIPAGSANAPIVLHTTSPNFLLTGKKQVNGEDVRLDGGIRMGLK